MKKYIIPVVAALAAMVTTAPAWAAGPPYTVSVGGSAVAGAHAYGAVTPAGSLFQFYSSPTIGFSCSGLSLGGSIQSGSAVNPVASITSNTFTGCSWGSYPLTMTMTTGPIVGTGTNATPGSEQVDVVLSNVLISAVTTPAVCSFQLKGKLRGFLDETTQRLVVAELGFVGNLTLSSVTGCLGWFRVGQSLDASGPLAISSPDGALDLS